MKNFDVVALGELLIDFTENGLSQQGNGIFEANPGGAPCNVLAMLRKFGHKCAFIGKVGEDSFGHMLAETVEELGIDISGIRYDKNVHTTLAFVQTAKDGDRSFSFYRDPGADVCLDESEVDYELIENAKIFHFGTLSMTHPTVEKATKKAIETAKNAKAIISFDPNLRPPLWSSLDLAKEKMAYGMANCNILKISDDEIEFFTGEKDIRTGVNKILKDYPIELVCATMGKEGSMAFYKGKEVFAAPVLREDTIETTGAGDTFMGCILHSVLENGLENISRDKLENMLVLANAAASDITTRRGALKVMPDIATLEGNFLK